MRVRHIIAGLGAAGLALATFAAPRPLAAAAPPKAAACAANAAKANLNFTLKDVNDKTVNLADYKGKVLLLDFWATWCAPCQIEIPAFIDLHNKYKSQGFELVGVVVLDKFSNVKPYSEKFRMNYPVLNGDGRNDIEDAFGTFLGLPTSFLIGRDGRICQTHIGLPQTRSVGNAAQIKALFEAEIKALL